MLDQQKLSPATNSSVLATLPTLESPISTVDSPQLDSVFSALEALKAGQAVVVVDNESRENEGDLICAAQFATPNMINFLAVEARGLICLAMSGEQIDKLQLPPMVKTNTDSQQTAFTINIVERVPLVTKANNYNSHYLATKAEKLSHLLR